MIIVGGAVKYRIVDNNYRSWNSIVMLHVRIDVELLIFFIVFLEN